MLFFYLSLTSACNTKKMNEIKQYYNKLAPDYDTCRFDNSYGKYIDTLEKRVLRVLFKNTPNSIIIDVPCGTGRLSQYATKGVDIAPNMVAEAQKKHRGKQFIVAAADKLPFENQSVDAIISFHFLMHLNKHHTKLILDEYSRVLKPHGRLIFDISSRKRREIIHYKAHNWHGAQSFSLNEIKQLHQNFGLSKSYGLMLFPIHRFPMRLRQFWVGLDYFFGNIIFKEYCSYMVVELIKKTE